MLLLRSPTARILLLALVATLSCLTRGPARADEALARQHFKRGIELYDKKQYAAALSEFQDAYKEKPSAGIKQNIALCHKGLGKPVEAATSFDEALDEGQSTLKPETRAAIEQELSELAKLLATLNLTVTSEDKRPVADVTISIKDDINANVPTRVVPASALRRPIRLMPGVYVINARAAGFQDPEPKKLALIAGAPVDAAFVVRASGVETGTLTVTADVDEATIKIDGVEVAKGTFRGTVAAGTRHVEVAAPGKKATAVDVTITANTRVELPIHLIPYADAPPEYVAPSSRPVKDKRMVLVPMVMLNAASYRLGVPLGEPSPYGTRRDFGGGALGVRLGYRLPRRAPISVELDAEIGTMNAKYSLPGEAESTTTVRHWQLVPSFRLTLPRDAKVRFISALGLGVRHSGVEGRIVQKGQTLTKNGDSLGMSWLVDAGIQIDLGPVFLEGAVFLDIHTIQGVRDDNAPNDRFLYASPATRGGLRVGLGFSF